jgi:hypothetical protein
LTYIHSSASLCTWLYLFRHRHKCHGYGFGYGTDRQALDADPDPDPPKYHNADPTGSGSSRQFAVILTLFMSIRYLYEYGLSATGTVAITLPTLPTLVAPLYIYLRRCGRGYVPGTGTCFNVKNQKFFHNTKFLVYNWQWQSRKISTGIISNYSRIFLNFNFSS